VRDFRSRSESPQSCLTTYKISTGCSIYSSRAWLLVGRPYLIRPIFYRSSHLHSRLGLCIAGKHVDDSISYYRVAQHKRDWQRNGDMLGTSQHPLFTVDLGGRTKNRGFSEQRRVTPLWRLPANGNLQWLLIAALPVYCMRAIRPEDWQGGRQPDLQS
jgi:hypothetical protein